MIKFLYKFLSLFWLSVFIGNIGWAANLTQADLKDLFGDDFTAKQQAVVKVVQAPPEVASTILFALQDENVFMTQKHEVVIKSQSTYLDPITNSEIKVDESIWKLQRLTILFDPISKPQSVNLSYFPKTIKRALRQLKLYLTTWVRFNQV